MGILTQTHNGLSFLGTATHVKADSTIITTFTSSGNVGIGTTTPAYTLDVNGTAKATTLRVHNNDPAIHFVDSADSMYEGMFRYRNNFLEWLWGGGMKFRVSADGGVAISQDYSTSSIPAKGLILPGNVGIGTTSPTYPLTVHKDLGSAGILAEFKNTNATYQQQLTLSFNSSKDVTFDQGSSNGGTIFETGNRGHSFAVNGTTNVVFNGSGNVGIGATSPIAKLQVGGGTNNSGSSIAMLSGDSSGILNALSLVNRVGGTNGRGVRLSFHNNSSWSATGAIETIQTDSTSAALAFRTYNGSLTEKMRITADGKVGIGTTNPAQKLQVDGGIYSNGDHLYVNSGYGVTAVGDLVFRTHDSAYIERMRIKANGNVGIGTTSPLAKLDIVGNQRIVHSSSLAGLEVYTNSAIPLAPQVRIGRDSGQYYGIQVTDGDARLIHRQDEAGTGTHSIINEIWTSTSGGGTWTWRLRENSGAFREDYMTLNSSSLTVAGTINVENASTNLSQANSAGVLKVTTSHGWTNIGPANSSWSHFDTDRAQFYFNKPTEFNGTVKPYTNNNRDLGSSSKQWNRVYGRYIYQDGVQVLSTRAQVHTALYSTGGNADTYTQFGIYRNYAESGPINGHNTILNVMQSDGNYGFQLGANTTADVDGLYYRSKNTGFGGGVWNQIASRSWVQSQGYVTSATDSQTLSWGSGNGQLTISNGNTVDLDGRYMYGAVGNGGDFNDLTSGKNSNFVAFNANNITDAPDTAWYNGLVTTHSNYLSSYIVNKHRTNDWYLSWRDTNNTPSANWSRIWHDRDFSSTDIANWNTAYGWGDHSTAGYMTPIYNGADNNSGKADFAVGTGGYGAVSLRSNQVQIGGDDMNYTGRFDATSTYVSVRTWDRDLLFLTNGSSSGTNVQHIKFSTKPNGGSGTERVRIDGDGYTYFHGLDLAISNVNSDHGKGNYLRGTATHLVIGTGGTLHLNMSGNTTVMHGNNWYPGSNGTTNLGTSSAYFNRVFTNSMQGGGYTQINDYTGGSTWYMRSNGNFVFANGHDWTLSFGLYINQNGVPNGSYAELGQRTSNQEDGRYKGVRIVKRKNSAVIDGDLRSGKLYVYGDSTSAWDRHITLDYAGTDTGAILTDGDGMKLRNLTTGNGFYFRNSSNATSMLINDSSNVAIGNSNVFTTGGTAKLSVVGTMISLGYSNSDLAYFRRLSAGNFQWQTFDGGNSGNIHLQPYGGNVGIGTTTPQVKLHVEGRIRSSYSGNTAWYGGNFVRLFNSQAFNFFNVGGSSIAQINLSGNSYFNGGNVGIGITAPTNKLEVVESGSFKAGGKIHFTNRVSVVGAGEANGTIIKLNDEHNTNLNTGYHYIIQDTTDGTGTNSGCKYLVWYDRDNGQWLSRLISRSGSSSNHPQVAVSGSNVKIFDTHSGTYPHRYIVTAYLKSDADGSPHSMGADFMWQRDVNNLSYTDGNVGIGTTTPAYKLDVSGSINATSITVGDGNISRVRIGGNTAMETNSGFLYIDPNNSFGSGIYINNAVRVDGGLIGSYNEDLQLRTGTTTRMVLSNSTGNVGIGTTNPTQKLHVIGNANLAGKLGSYVGDTGVILQSYNASATNAEQFRINHDYGKVEISNPRGDIEFKTPTYFESTTVVEDTQYVGVSIQHWGDGGTGMYFNTDSVDIRTAGNIRLAVNNGSIDISHPVSSTAKIATGAYFETNTSQSRDKIRVWNSHLYTIGMKSGYTFGPLGNDYAMSFQMNNSSSRGFWWGDDVHTDAQGAMALSTNGRLTVARSVRIGYGETDTTDVPSGVLDVNGDMYIQGNVLPITDRAYTLGIDSKRWQIVFCETLDSAGQHEANLQNPEGEKSVGEYKTGTVLVWKGGKNLPCNREADHMRMGVAVEGIESPLIQGAEPVLVTGPVTEGDYLITSEVEGHAKAISRDEMIERNLQDCVFGKALETANGESHLVKVWINI